MADTEQLTLLVRVMSHLPLTLLSPLQQVYGGGDGVGHAQSWLLNVSVVFAICVFESA